MNLPQIDVSALPNLDAMTGVFGSLAHQAALVSGDGALILITFLYDILGD